MADTLENILGIGSNTPAQQNTFFEGIERTPLKEDGTTFSEDSGYLFKDLPLPTEMVSEPSDPDDYLNRVGVSFNNAQKNIAESVMLLGDKLDIPVLKEWGASNIEQQIKDLQEYGQPTRTSSLTQGMDEISQIYKEKGLSAALERGSLLAKDMSADALGSTGLPIAAGLAAIPVGAVAGSTVGAAAGLILPFTTGAALVLAPIYNEAINSGASEEDALNVAIGGSVVSGLLDRLGAGVVISQLVKQFGKKAVTDEIALTTGKSAAKKGVDAALRFAKNVTVGGTKAGFAEAITEAAQEVTQEAAVNMATGTDMFPYQDPQYRARLIDSAALGFMGGKTIGSVTTPIAKSMARDRAIRAAELEEDLVNLSKGVDDLGTDIAYTEKFSGTFTDPTPMSTSRTIRGIFQNPLAPLRDLATRGDGGGARVVNSLTGFYENLSSETGKDLQQFQDAITPLKRSIKLPFVQKDISPAVSKRIIDVMETGKPDQDNNVNTVASSLRNLLGTVEIDNETGLPKKSVRLKEKDITNSIKKNSPIESVLKAYKDGDISKDTLLQIENTLEPARLEYIQRLQQSPSERNSILNDIVSKEKVKELKGLVISKPQATGLFAKAVEAGVPLSFLNNYVPAVHKQGYFANKKRAKILKEKFGLNPQQTADINDNIAGNEGIFIEDDITLDLEGVKNKKSSAATIAAEQKRKLSPEMIDELSNAGLMEENVEGLMYRYVTDLNKRIESQKLANILNEEIPKLKNNIYPEEKRHIENIYKATQGAYKSLNNPSFKRIQRWILTHQYIATLPLVGITALTEPIIILSRINPKYAALGTSKAIVNSLNSGLRKIFPKLPKTEAERAFKDILQGFDGVLADRFGDLANVSSSKKVTNAFFKATMLTTITQISRDMAFQAARLQMENDLKTIAKYDAISATKKAPQKKTQEYLLAKKRLKQQGIVNPMDDTVQNWAAEPNALEQSDPSIIRKALAKTVDEFIMSPNAVNRPLWMSNPHLATVAQLKGFLATFGNIVGGRIWRDIAVPLGKGRIPATDIMKYSITFSLIVAASLFTQSLRDRIRYGDEKSPFEELDGLQQIIEALLRTNIFGLGSVAYDAMNAQKYGSNFWSAILGPTASTVSGLAEAGSSYVFSDNPRQLAREITNLIPILKNIPMVRDVKQEFVDALEDKLEDLKDMF